MENKKPQFKYRIKAGVTDLRLRDNAVLRREIMRSFEKLAPLLDDFNPGEPSFDDLKRDDGFRRFVASIEGEVELLLFVSAFEGRNIEKAVGVLDASGRVCAAVHWRSEDDTTEFKIFN